MATWRQAQRARESIDNRIAGQNLETRLMPPQRGWVRAIRDALQMTAGELGARMGVTDAAVRSTERSELEGGASLSTLRRAVEAMDCTFVYGFVPNSSLQDTVDRQATAVLNEQLTRSHQTMLLEDQEGSLLDSDRAALLEGIVRSRGLWSRS